MLQLLICCGCWYQETLSVASGKTADNASTSYGRSYCRDNILEFCFKDAGIKDKESVLIFFMTKEYLTESKKKKKKALPIEVFAGSEGHQGIRISECRKNADPRKKKKNQTVSKFIIQ